MAKGLRRKYGVVAVLDALGAANYSDAQIRRFLSVRTDVNSTITYLAQDIPKGGPPFQPRIFTFGDTIIITLELRSKKYMRAHLTVFLMLLRRYLFHSFLGGVLFRGAFSIDYYFEDAGTNTVLGSAVADAASWYNRSNWVGVSSTPKTKSVLEYFYYDGRGFLEDSRHIVKYQVPMTDGTTFLLYSISWPGAFFTKEFMRHAKQEASEKWFLDLLRDLPMPAGTEIKYENTRAFFSHVQNALTKT